MIWYIDIHSLRLKLTIDVNIDGQNYEDPKLAASFLWFGI